MCLLELFFLSCVFLNFPFYHSGRLTEALVLYQEALDGRQDVLGNKNDKTLRSMSSKAQCLRKQGALCNMNHFTILSQN